MTDSATSTTYSVPEISCGHCKSTIEAAVRSLGASAEVDIDAKTVTVAGGDHDAIVAAIEDVGFDVER